MEVKVSCGQEFLHSCGWIPNCCLDRSPLVQIKSPTQRMDSWNQGTRIIHESCSSKVLIKIMWLFKNLCNNPRNPTILPMCTAHTERPWRLAWPSSIFHDIWVEHDNWPLCYVEWVLYYLGACTCSNGKQFFDKMLRTNNGNYTTTRSICIWKRSRLSLSTDSCSCPSVMSLPGWMADIDQGSMDSPHRFEKMLSLNCALSLNEATTSMITTGVVSEIFWSVLKLKQGYLLATHNM